LAAEPGGDYVGTGRDLSMNNEEKRTGRELSLQGFVSPVINQHSREKLDSYIVHYNKMFGTNFSTRDHVSFYNYYNDISKKVKERQIDILLVVNMFSQGLIVLH
jgi:hypothetical protein